MDRWFMNASGGSLTASLVNTTTGGITFGNQSSQRSMALYAVPNDRTIAVRSAPLSLGLDASCGSGTIALRWAVLAWTGTADAPNKSVVNNWTSGTFTTGNFFASTSLTQVGTGNWTVTTTTIRYTAENLGTVPSGATNLMLCVWHEAAGTTAVTVNNVCLNPASTAATFILPLAEEQIAACSRYLALVADSERPIFSFVKASSDGFYSQILPHSLRVGSTKSVVWAPGSAPTWVGAQGSLTGNTYIVNRWSTYGAINLQSVISLDVREGNYNFSVTGSVGSEAGPVFLYFASGSGGPIGLISAEL